MRNELAHGGALKPHTAAHPLRFCVLSWIGLSAGSWLVIGLVVYAAW